MAHSSLATISVPAHSGNYTKGRGGNKINHITVHHCLPIDETELLTPDGWKYLSDIEVGDVVMTSNERLNMKFDSVLAMVPIREDTVYDGRGIIATKEHRMLTRRHNEEGYKVRTLEEVFATNGADYIPNAGFANYEGLPLSDDEIEFLAMVQADGSMDYNTPYLRFYKERKINRCRGLLTRLGYSYIEKQFQDKIHPSGGVLFRVNDKLAKKIVSEWLDAKKFSWKMLYMSQEQAEAFADALTYWDGCRVQHKSMLERRYTSIVQQNKDVVAAILAINGIGTNQTGRHLLTYKERLDRSISVRSSFEERKALVSCVEVPSGFILIRQNGYTTIVGNCAGVLSAEQCGAIFARAGRRGSAHYGIGNDGKIAWYVDEGDRAWSDSNWPSNCTTVSVETSNSATGGDWPVGDAAYNSLVKLVADIAKRNGLGTLVAGKNLTWHNMYAKTICPGPYLQARIEDIANKANAINGGSPAPQPTPTVGFLPPKGYWTLGDQDVRVGRLASFMRKTFPSYTPPAALGNYYGRNLFGAIKEFQRRTGLEADGSTGPKTYKKLQSFGFKG